MGAPVDPRPIADYEGLRCGVNARHYEVISPEMYSGPQGYEPPEWWRCWGFYLAKNRKDARRQAVKDPEFREWVNEQRASNMPPFKGLEVKPFTCLHGACLGCGDEDGPDCGACRYEMATGEPHNDTLVLLGGPPAIGRTPSDA